MKEATLQTLITARALLEQADRYCSLGDRYLATAGLIVLQDAVELIFLAVLIEKEVDENQSVEKFTFDEMIAAVGKLGIKVPKTGTLKAMNKLRVTAKHYGQIMEPLTVQDHLNTAKFVIDIVLTCAIGKPLREVFLTELVGEIRSRQFLDDAVSALASGNYLETLISTRKAFFLEFEEDYCIYQYRNAFDSRLHPLFGFLLIGRKAPPWTRDPDWIRENVKDPFGYIQIDYEKWRIDAMEWGINTQTLNNIRWLTPNVIRLEADKEWQTRFPAAYKANSANHENAAICLDLTIEVIRRKYEHLRAARTPSVDKPYEMPTAYIGQPVLKRAAYGDEPIHVLAEGDSYTVHQILSGFDANQTFYYINCTTSSGNSIYGYVGELDAQPLEEPYLETQIPLKKTGYTPLPISFPDVNS